jgi:hypothetical protein
MEQANELHFACGTTGYKMLLSQNQPLPSLRTLRHIIQNIKFDSGILHQVFDFLKIKVGNMNPLERICSLTLDEMSLKSSTEFYNGKGSLCGNVNLTKT